MVAENLVAQYEGNSVALDRALLRVSNDLSALLSDFAHDYKVRYKRSFDKRIKSLESVKEKLRRKNVDDLFALTDLVGVKIIVHNLSDAKNLCQLLNEKWALKRLTVEDYITSPKVTGYRGIHLNFFEPVEVKGNKLSVPVEIQIKTLAEDLWSILSHEDLYKAESEIPEIINQFSTSLGALLDVVDNQAQFIRDFISKKVVISKDLTFDPDDEVDKQIVAKIIFDNSGYEITQQDFFTLAKCLESYHITTADTLRKLLSTQKIRKQISAMFSKFDLGEPGVLDFVVYGSAVYYEYMSTDEVNEGTLEERIKEDFDITEEMCCDCGKYLKAEEVDNSSDKVEDGNLVCYNCISYYNECPKCNMLTPSDFLCRSCEEWLEGQ